MAIHQDASTSPVPFWASTVERLLDKQLRHYIMLRISIFWYLDWTKYFNIHTEGWDTTHRPSLKPHPLPIEHADLKSRDGIWLIRNNILLSLGALRCWGGCAWRTIWVLTLGVPSSCKMSEQDRAGNKELFRATHQVSQLRRLLSSIFFCKSSSFQLFWYFS